MKKFLTALLLIMLLAGIFCSGCVNQPEPEPPDNQGDDSIQITVDSAESPIRKYFTTPKILWTFDDYSVQYHHHPPHKGFGGLTERINSYGGYVQIMAIFTTEVYTKPFGNILRNYSVVDDFGYSLDDVTASTEFFNRPKVSVGCHGWNHTGNLNYINLSFAYTMVTYTMWNWKNNYGVTPHFFLGPSTTGNWNFTYALQRFSEQYWPVYGENFRWYNSNLFNKTSRDAPAVEYIDKPLYVAEFDPLFGADWGTPSKNVQEAMDLYNRSSAGKEILFIRGHPSYLNGTDQKAVENLSFWEQWIDWVYQTHDLININHTEAIHYNIDRYNFSVIKNNNESYTINLTNCSFSHSVLFSKPWNSTKEWAVYDEQNKFLGNIQDATFLDLTSGSIYQCKVK